MAQPYRVEALTLHQIGVFDDVSIDFRPISSADKAEIHLFTGPNGCGKSTLLYALAGIFDGFSTDSLIRRRYRGSESCVDFCFARYNGSSRILPNISYENSYAGYTRRFSEDNSTYSQTGFSYAAFAYSGQRTLHDTKLTAIQQITNSPFEDALSFDGSVRPPLLLQWIANNRTQSALAKQDGDEKAAQIYDQALGRITSLIQDICDLELEFRLERSPLAVTVRVNGDTIHFDTLPDGLKSIISWVTDLSLRLEAIPWREQRDVFSQPIILLLDEVDIHLHPKWQRRILPAIQNLLPNAQVFVSTHSPFVVGSVEDAWVYRLPEPNQNKNIIEGIPSGAGKSYRLILNEIFGIDKEFDVETEAMFDEFYRLRALILKDPNTTEALLNVAKKLALRSEESALIVSRELRQISRLTGLELNLA